MYVVVPEEVTVGTPVGDAEGGWIVGDAALQYCGMMGGCGGAVLGPRWRDHLELASIDVVWVCFYRGGRESNVEHTSTLYGQLKYLWFDFSSSTPHTRILIFHLLEKPFFPNNPNNNFMPGRILQRKYPHK